MSTLKDMIRGIVEQTVKETLAEVMGEMAGQLPVVGQPITDRVDRAELKAQRARAGFQPGARVLYVVNGRVSQKTIDSMRAKELAAFRAILKRGSKGISAQELGEMLKDADGSPRGRKAENQIFTLRRMGAIKAVDVK